MVIQRVVVELGRDHWSRGDHHGADAGGAGAHGREGAGDLDSTRCTPPWVGRSTRRTTPACRWTATTSRSSGSCRTPTRAPVAIPSTSRRQHRAREPVLHRRRQRDRHPERDPGHQPAVQLRPRGGGEDRRVRGDVRAGAGRGGERRHILRHQRLRGERLRLRAAERAVAQPPRLAPVITESGAVSYDVGARVSGPDPAGPALVLGGAEPRVDQVDKEIDAGLGVSFPDRYHGPAVRREAHLAGQRDHRASSCRCSGTPPPGMPSIALPSGYTSVPEFGCPPESADARRRDRLAPRHRDAEPVGAAGDVRLAAVGSVHAGRRDAARSLAGAVVDDVTQSVSGGFGWTPSTTTGAAPA